MSTILEVKNLTVRFGNFEALKNISFSLEEKEISAILGPNGAGKTTLFLTLLGLLPYEGEIIWHKPVNIGYVPQRLEIDLNTPLTVKELFLLENTFSFWSPSLSQLNDIKNNLSHSQSGFLLDYPLYKLSRGQLQRVLIALALHKKPNFFLFDEPLAGVDIEGEATIYTLINHFAKEAGLSVLMISHDLNVVYQWADKVICLNSRLVCEGHPRQVLTTETLQKLYSKNITFYQHVAH